MSLSFAYPNMYRQLDIEGDETKEEKKERRRRTTRIARR
jgi:hypothetical protein